MEGRTNGRGHDDLTAVRREADPRGSVDRKPDVTAVGKRGTPAVQPDSQPHVNPLGPTPGMHRPLDRERRVKRPGGEGKHGEDVVSASGRLATTGMAHRVPHPTSDIGEQRPVSIAETAKQLG